MTITIISGGATGVDSLAERYAKENGIDCKVFEAKWNKYGKYDEDAGTDRNALSNINIARLHVRGT